MIDDANLVALCRHLLDEAVEGDEESEHGLGEFTGELERIALAGNRDAQDLLGGIALSLAEDPDAAARWFRLSADAGSPVGARSLGFLHSVGDGVPLDPGAAVELFRIAAAAGDAPAKVELARLARRGAVDLPPGEITALLTAAAADGNAEACAELGELLSAADRDAEALAHFTAAAAAGHEGATATAAERYRAGIGTAPDPVRAVQHYLMLLNHGRGDGIHDALDLARGMTDDEVRLAGRLAGREAEAAAVLATVRSAGES